MSYSGNPADSPKDDVRHIIGDTNWPTHEFLNDEEIEFELAKVSDDVDAAAIVCAQRMAARVFPKVDYVMHGVTVRGSQLIQNLRDLVEFIRDQSQTSALQQGAAPFVGGVSRAERLDEDVAEGDSVRQKAFRIGMHDAPGTVST